MVESNRHEIFNYFKIILWLSQINMKYSITLKEYYG